MKPECRLRAKDEGTGYPRSGCLRCGWKVLGVDKIQDMCTDSDYNGSYKPNATAHASLSGAESDSDYRIRMYELANHIIDGTGLQKHIPEHKALIVMYALMALHKGKETTQEDIHDAWALWTLFIRELPTHDNMVPFDALDERTKVLDKVDMIAIHDAVEACK